jgi:hypothetical protein
VCCLLWFPFTHLREMFLWESFLCFTLSPVFSMVISSYSIFRFYCFFLACLILYYFSLFFLFLHSSQCSWSDTNPATTVYAEADALAKFLKEQNNVDPNSVAGIFVF